MRIRTRDVQLYLLTVVVTVILGGGYIATMETEPASTCTAVAERL